MTVDELTEELRKLVASIDNKRRDIAIDTNILSELDFNSLQLLELAERIKTRFGTQILGEPFALIDIESALTLANAMLVKDPSNNGP